MNRTIAVLIAAALLGANTTVLAADWILLSDNWYVDRDSNSRQGDIGTVITRVGDGSGGVGRLTFDCARQLYLPVAHPFTGMLRPPVKIEGERELAVALALACRRAWEIWK